MSIVNKDEAPEGYYAVATRGFSCALCAFLTEREYDCDRPLASPSCTHMHRSDGCNVIFKRKCSSILREEAK